MKIKLFSILIVSSLVSNLFAWENGNAFQLKSMAKIVPALSEIINERERDEFVKYSRVLDSTTSFDQYTFLTKKTKKALNRNKLYNTKSLRLPKALPLMFTFLVNSFKDKNRESTIFWSSCISHAVNNIYSPYEEISLDFLREHTFKNRLITSDGLKVDFEKTSGIRLSTMLKNSFLKQKRLEFENSFQANTYARNFKNFYKTLFLLPFTKHSTRQDLCESLAQTMNIITFSEDEEEIRKEKLKGSSIIYNLSILALRNTADIIQTAKDYAEFNTDITVPEMNDEILKDIRASIATREITGKKGELFYKSLINAPNDSHDVAIIVEPSYINGKAILGNNSKIIASSIAGYLHKTKASYTLMDLRHIVGLDSEQKITLDPKKIPTLIIPISEYQQINEFEFTQRNFAKPFVKYIRKGGKIIWIGSAAPNFFGSFAVRQIKVSTKEKNFETNILNTSSLGVKIDLEEGLKFYPLVSTPFLDKNLSTISKLVPESNKTVPLIDLLHEEEELKETIAFAIKDRRQKKLQFAIVPTYLFIPNLLTKTTTQIWPLCLDKKAGKILTELIERLK